MMDVDERMKYKYVLIRYHNAMVRTEVRKQIEKDITDELNSNGIVSVDNRIEKLIVVLMDGKVLEL